MNNIWLVFKHEYSRHVLRKRFIIAVLSVPLMALVIIAASFLAARSGYDGRPAGYIDRSGLFANAQQLPVEEDAFHAGDSIPRLHGRKRRRRRTGKESHPGAVCDCPDYMHTGKVQMIALDSPGSQVQSDFQDFLVANLLAGKNPAVVKRLTEGSTLKIKNIEGNREMSDNNFLAILVPIIAGVLFMVAINTSGGYLLQAVVEEKENRTMEIMVTSISPSQLMAGKSLGISAWG